MYLPIKDFKDLDNASLSLRHAIRIAKTSKRYAVINADKLHLVNDLNRLVFDTLKHDDLYDIEVYQLR